MLLGISYDKRFDNLYIKVGDNQSSIGCEEYDGLVVMRDFTSRKITGLKLFGFMGMYHRGSLPKWPDGINIDVDREIIPLI